MVRTGFALSVQGSGSDSEDSYTSDEDDEWDSDEYEEQQCAGNRAEAQGDAGDGNASGDDELQLQRQEKEEAEERAAAELRQAHADREAELKEALLCAAQAALEESSDRSTGFTDFSSKASDPSLPDANSLPAPGDAAGDSPALLLGVAAARPEAQYARLADRRAAATQSRARRKEALDAKVLGLADMAPSTSLSPFSRERDTDGSFNVARLEKRVPGISRRVSTGFNRVPFDTRCWVTVQTPAALRPEDTQEGGQGGPAALPGGVGQTPPRDAPLCSPPGEGTAGAGEGGSTRPTPPGEGGAGRGSTTAAAATTPATPSREAGVEGEGILRGDGGAATTPRLVSDQEAEGEGEGEGEEARIHTKAEAERGWGAVVLVAPEGGLSAEQEEGGVEVEVEGGGRATLGPALASVGCVGRAEWAAMWAAEAAEEGPRGGGDLLMLPQQQLRRSVAPDIPHPPAPEDAPCVPRFALDTSEPGTVIHTSVLDILRRGCPDGMDPSDFRATVLKLHSALDLHRLTVERHNSGTPLPGAKGIIQEGYYEELRSYETLDSGLRSKIEWVEEEEEEESGRGGVTREKPKLPKKYQFARASSYLAAMLKLQVEGSVVKKRLDRVQDIDFEVDELAYQNACLLHAVPREERGRRKTLPASSFGTSTSNGPRRAGSARPPTQQPPPAFLETALQQQQQHPGGGDIPASLLKSRMGSGSPSGSPRKGRRAAGKKRRGVATAYSPHTSKRGMRRARGGGGGGEASPGGASARQAAAASLTEAIREKSRAAAEAEAVSTLEAVHMILRRRSLLGRGPVAGGAARRRAAAQQVVVAVEEEEGAAPLQPSGPDSPGGGAEILDAGAVDRGASLDGGGVAMSGRAVVMTASLARPTPPPRVTPAAAAADRLGTAVHAPRPTLSVPGSLRCPLHHLFGQDLPEVVSASLPAYTLDLSGGRESYRGDVQCNTPAEPHDPWEQGLRPAMRALHHIAPSSSSPPPPQQGGFRSLSTPPSGRGMGIRSISPHCGGVGSVRSPAKRVEGRGGGGGGGGGGGITLSPLPSGGVVAGSGGGGGGGAAAVRSHNAESALRHYLCLRSAKPPTRLGRGGGGGGGAAVPPLRQAAQRLRRLQQDALMQLDVRRWRNMAGGRDVPAAPLRT